MLQQRFFSGSKENPATEWSADLFGFESVEGQAMAAGFDGGTMISDAGALLLAATDRAIGLIERFARCFSDNRSQDRVSHRVSPVVDQRVFGIALGYEDLLELRCTLAGLHLS